MEATFYFDVGSPYAWLSAERLEAVLGPDVRWQPILLGGVFKATGRSSWALADPAGRADGSRRSSGGRRRTDCRG